MNIFFYGLGLLFLNMHLSAESLHTGTLPKELEEICTKNNNYYCHMLRNLFVCANPQNEATRAYCKQVDTTNVNWKASYYIKTLQLNSCTMTPHETIELIKITFKALEEHGYVVSPKRDQIFRGDDTYISMPDALKEVCDKKYNIYCEQLRDLLVCAYPKKRETEAYCQQVIVNHRNRFVSQTIDCIARYTGSISQKEALELAKEVKQSLSAVSPSVYHVWFFNIAGIVNYLKRLITCN